MSAELGVDPELVCASDQSNVRRRFDYKKLNERSIYEAASGRSRRTLGLRILENVLLLIALLMTLIHGWQVLVSLVKEEVEAGGGEMACGLV